MNSVPAFEIRKFHVFTQTETMAKRLTLKCFIAKLDRQTSDFLDDEWGEVVAVEDVAVVVELEVANRSVAPEGIPRSRGQHFDARAIFMNKF